MVVAMSDLKAFDQVNLTGLYVRIVCLFADPNDARRTEEVETLACSHDRALAFQGYESASRGHSSLDSGLIFQFWPIGIFGASATLSWGAFTHQLQSVEPLVSVLLPVVAQ